MALPDIRPRLTRNSCRRWSPYGQRHGAGRGRRRGGLPAGGVADEGRSSI